MLIRFLNLYSFVSRQVRLVFSRRTRNVFIEIPKLQADLKESQSGDACNFANKQNDPIRSWMSNIEVSIPS